jgi:hypothetical protein
MGKGSLAIAAPRHPRALRANPNNTRYGAEQSMHQHLAHRTECWFVGNRLHHPQTGNGVDLIALEREPGTLDGSVRK